MAFFRMSVHGDLPTIRKPKTAVADSPGASGHALDNSATPPTQPSANAAFRD